VAQNETEASSLPAQASDAVEEDSAQPMDQSIHAQTHFTFHAIQAAEQELLFLQSQIDFVTADYYHLRDVYREVAAQIETLSATPLTVGQFVELVSEGQAIVQPSTMNSNVLVRISSSVDRTKLKPLTTVALNRQSQSILKILPSENDASTTMVSLEKRPTVTYADIGGYDQAKLEVREAIELPITNPEVFQRLNIQPPNALLLYGPPGCAKSLLVKALANACECSFIAINSPQIVNKYLGEGARAIRDVFRLARDRAPCIIFFDEIDSIATKRSDQSTEGDKEVGRILMELLAQLDGFDNDGGVSGGKVVKVIFATNRPDVLDPALLRTGRADRKIHMDYPTKRDRRLIFQVCTKGMTLDKDVDFEVFVAKNEKLSGADIKSVCVEAGMNAIRGNRFIVTHADFEAAYKVVVGKRVKEEGVFE